MVLAILAIAAGLGYAAYRSPHHWAASGLACMTASAVITSPELLRSILQAGNHPAVIRFASAITRGLRRLSLIVYGLLVLLASAIVALGRPHSAAIGIVFFFGVVVGALELFAWEVRSLTAELMAGGHVDRQVARRFGRHRRWPLAGALFLAGTLLQLVGTYLE